MIELELLRHCLQTMIISPPFLPDDNLTRNDPASVDPIMDAVDTFELSSHGIYPIAFDRRWHCGVHLQPRLKNEAVRAIADGEVVAYRVSQKAIADGQKDDKGSDALNSNTGFVLLKHTTETGDSRTIIFYSLYMHLLDLNGIRQMVGPQPNNPPDIGSSTVQPKWLAFPTDGIKIPKHLKVFHKDILGYQGECHGQSHLHFEIFMTEGDFDAYFKRTQLGKKVPDTPEGSDWWGHAYFAIPAGRDFSRLPPGVDNHNKLAGIPFVPGEAGRNDLPLQVETYFSKGAKYINVWSVTNDGTRKLLTPQPVAEPDYEYDLYRRATALYPACPSDGYELLRFGRTLSTSGTLRDQRAGTSSPVSLPGQRETWVRVPYATDHFGYIDINDSKIVKLSDADFPAFMGWQKIEEGNTPFSQDGLCDHDALRKIVAVVEDMETPAERLRPEFEQEDKLAAYIQTHAEVRNKLRGFICHAPSEWDAGGNEARYKRLNGPDGFFGKRKATDPNGYDNFIKFLKQFQFLEQTSLGGGKKFWFFHPLAFIRHFRKCGWLSLKEITQCVRSTVKENGKEVSTIAASDITMRLTNASARRPADLYPSFSSTMLRYGINNAMRQAHFFGQVLQETGRLEFMVEGGRDSYFNKYEPGTDQGTKLGNTQPGDGLLFKGRGLIQLTGRTNYSNYSKYRNKRYLAPSDVEKLESHAFETTDAAGYYWASKQRYKLQDKKLVEFGKPSINWWADQGASYTAQRDVTRCVNPGLNHFEFRQQYFEHAYFALNAETVRPPNFKPAK